MLKPCAERHSFILVGKVIYDSAARQINFAISCRAAFYSMFHLSLYLIVKDNVQVMLRIWPLFQSYCLLPIF